MSSVITNLYNLARNTYLNLKPHQTSDFERYWTKRKYGRDWNGKQKGLFNGYWRSINHPHRLLLFDVIERTNPYLVLEVGCNCGVNLYGLSKRNRNMECFGIDLNRDAVRYGREALERERMNNVHLYKGNADKFKLFEVTEFDTIFTDACLIYIGDDKIDKVMEQLTQNTKRLVLLERHITSGRDGAIYIDGLWCRDYMMLIKKFWPDAKVNFIPITKEIWPEWSNGGYIIEAIE